MKRKTPAHTTQDTEPEHLAALFPEAFVERLITPLFATPEGAAAAVEVLGAPLAHACVGRARAPAVDAALLHGGAAEESLRSRLIRKRAVALIGDLAAEGIQTIAMKGLATAYSVYPRPAYRLLPDVDMLFHEADLPRLARFLADKGFCTYVDPDDLQPWGALMKASYAPIFPPDRGFTIDVHGAVGEWPESRGIDAEDVFACATEIKTEWGPCPVVSHEHGFLIAALNAYRDFYRPGALKGVFDICLMVIRHGDTMDWGKIETMARRGRLVKRVVFYRELLMALGAPPPPLFTARRLGRGLGPMLDYVASNNRSLAWRTMGNARKLAFEALLLDSPFAAIMMNGRRLYHMAAPRLHYLPGVPVVDNAEFE